VTPHPGLSPARRRELLGYALDYARAHHLTIPNGAGGDVDTSADRTLIRAVQGHARGYHGDKRISVTGLLDGATGVLLEDAYGPHAPPAGVLYRPLPTPVPIRSEFAIVDAEGAPQGHDGSGAKWHAGLDWMAPGGTAIISPEAGQVVEAHDSGDRSGQVFGGTVRVRAASGRVWVFRHIAEPVSAGDAVRRGQHIANVSSWLDAPLSTHAHIELWRSWDYGTDGYFVANMVDPLPVLRTAIKAPA
jgi:murein DD-endopeptidase MepM/ murein hydrolase activator NlpD